MNFSFFEVKLAILFKRFPPPPPSINKLIQIRNKVLRKIRYHFRKDFIICHSFEEAKIGATGYAEGSILKKCKEAALKVKKGEAVYERDSVTFDKITHNYPLISVLLKTANENNNKIRIVDFGGSLGSVYNQCRPFLNTIDVKWNIVEQSHFVRCGRRHFQTDRLQFYYKVEECLHENKDINTILLSGVIQYLEEPYELLVSLISKKFQYIIIDRTPFLQSDSDHVAIQNVPAEIYKASYPSWFFSISKLISFFEKRGYELSCDWDTFVKIDKRKIPFKEKFEEKGMLFISKN